MKQKTNQKTKTMKQNNITSILTILFTFFCIIIHIMNIDAFSFTPKSIHHHHKQQNNARIKGSSDSGQKYLLWRRTITTYNELRHIATRQIVLCNSMKNQNSNNNNNSDDIDQYLDKASKLRKEVEELESVMKLEKGKKVDDGNNIDTSLSIIKDKKKTYTTLENSMWTISYRFASDPVSKENNNDSDVIKSPTFYSGKVSILLKDDGYTELIQSDDESQPLVFCKFWGWDEEISREDGKKYLSFSADVILPKSDPNYDQGGSSDSPSRFYFNSEVETDKKTGEISLTSGTITVKRDVEPPGGFWGIFSAGGILAQFRYCGDFLIKPK